MQEGPHGRFVPAGGNPGSACTGVGDAPIRKLSLGKLPAPGEVVTVSVTVEAERAAPETRVELTVSPGIVAERQDWTVDLAPYAPVTLNTRIVVAATGEHEITVRVLKEWSETEAWSDLKSIPFEISPTGVTRMGWSTALPPGETPPQPMKGIRAASPGDPSTAPNRRSRRLPRLPRANRHPGQVPLQGPQRRQPTHRSAVDRDSNGANSSFSPPVYCFTEVDGSYSCEVAPQCTEYRVCLYSWTNFIRDGGADRLGVFIGPGTTGYVGGTGETTWTAIRSLPTRARAPWTEFAISAHSPSREP